MTFVWYIDNTVKLYIRRKHGNKHDECARWCHFTVYNLKTTDGHLTEQTLHAVLSCHLWQTASSSVHIKLRSRLIYNIEDAEKILLEYIKKSSVGGHDN